MSNQNPILNISLSVTQINSVLGHLGRGVFGEVADLIFLIKEQANSQLEGLNNPAPTETIAETVTKEFSDGA